MTCPLTVPPADHLGWKYRPAFSISSFPSGIMPCDLIPSVKSETIPGGFAVCWDLKTLLGLISPAAFAEQRTDGYSNQPTIQTISSF
jgi:hypothetical protein